MIRRRRRIAPRSSKREAQRDERAAVVEAAYFRDGRDCVARVSVPQIRCGGRLDPHEVIPRSAWPGGALVLENVVTICRRHHDWVGDHPELAHDVGLHGFSWERPR